MIIFTMEKGLLAWDDCRRANSKRGLQCDWLMEHVCLSLVGPKVEAGAKLEKLAVIDQVLTVWGQLLQSCGLTFWTGCCRSCRSEFYYFIQVWSFSLCRFRLSLAMEESSSCCASSPVQLRGDGGFLRLQGILIVV